MNESRISYVNGVIKNHEDATLHIDDRATQFSDGAYEVILFLNNKLVDAKAHFERFEYSLKELDIDFKINQKEFSQLILNLFKKNNLSQGSCYIQITRGTCPRTQGYPKSLKPNCIITVKNLHQVTNHEFEQGFATITHEDIRWKRRDIKSTSLLGNTITIQKAKTHNAIEAILLDDDNNITEASFANVFIVNNNNEVITRPISRDILSGITRKRIIKIALASNYKVIERKFSKKDLLSAKEVFLTSSTLLLRPITRIDSQQINNGSAGKISTNLRDKYNQFIYTL